MDTMATKYGVIKGISSYELYPDGGIKECMLNEANEIETPWGKLIPQYQDGNIRRKYINSLKFYPSGSLRSIALHQQTSFKTPIGSFPAELVTFFENEQIKRIFPLNGKISGHWSEEDEFKLAREFDFEFSFGKFKKKVIAVYFYESGSVKGLTFWPGDSVCIHTPIGEAEARIGITLYQSGKLKSFEPNTPVAASTPIGEIIAYNPDAIGIHGDMNSLVFYEDGKLKALLSSHNLVTITDQNGEKEAVSPRLRRSQLDDSKIDIVPLAIIFNDNTVGLGNSFIKQYNTDDCTFTVHQIPQLYKPESNDCSSCDKCG
ncbi:MAG: hypothetical protein PHX14_04900 [Syntrophomonadaceae bacterium]|nr:hypothetical protein [Syntrophomonadaceae bacterium]